MEGSLASTVNSFVDVGVTVDVNHTSGCILGVTVGNKVEVGLQPARSKITKATKISLISYIIVDYASICIVKVYRKSILNAR